MTTLRIFDGTGRTLRAVGSHQVRMAAFAERHRGWHSAAKDRTTQRALAGLERRGIIERADTGQFRFKGGESRATALDLSPAIAPFMRGALRT